MNIRPTRKPLLAIVASLTIAVPAAHAIDHVDSPSAAADPAADIAGLYAWMDGGRVVLALTVHPDADATSKFSDAVQYVFHTESHASYAANAASVQATDIVCTFDAAQTIQCWVSDADYVTGDASDASAPLTSASGDVQVFAGPRADPTYFNLEGFGDLTAAVVSAAPSLSFDGSGCPAVGAGTATTWIDLMQGTSGGTQPAADFFAGQNALAIVLSLDPSLLAGSETLLSVWASTNQAGN